MQAGKRSCLAEGESTQDLRSQEQRKDNREKPVEGSNGVKRIPMTYTGRRRPARFLRTSHQRKHHQLDLRRQNERGL
uniref:Uncharacterized protein n=1 Tax=Mustela putorius furo TaxID=9669 RepID=M3XVS0_MUSPF